MSAPEDRRVWSARPVSELERLRSAVDYCRMRLKRDAYRETLEAILRGDKDESIRNPDFTEMILS